MTEVLDHAPAGWTPAERLVVVAIAEQANDRTRRGAPDVRLIAHRAGIDVESVSKTLRRLAAKGTELRMATGVDKVGRPIYAHRGHRTDFEIPRMCPEDEHRTNVCMKRPDAGPAKLERRRRADPAESTDHRPAYGEESPDAGPAIEHETPDGGPAIDPESTDGGPAKVAERPDGGPERPDGGPALPLSTPQRTTPQKPTPQGPPEPTPTDRWQQSDRQDSPTLDAMNRTPHGKQPALIAKPARMSERVEIVHDWLRINGYPEATPEDARAVERAVAAAYGSKVHAGYLRAMAGIDGGGFAGFYEDLRRQRGEEADRQIRELEKTKPECEHGTPAGGELHPTHQVPLCPQCRSKVPVRHDDRPGTDPAVAVALSAYRSATGHFSSRQFVRITQQAEALRRGGATADQLAELAHAAGTAGTDLLTTATSRKDT